MRVLGTVGSSRPEGGDLASARAALYPGEEAPRRRPVTPGLAGPSGLPPRHSLVPLHNAYYRNPLPADRHKSSRRPSEQTNEQTSDLRLPRPDNNKRPQESGSAAVLLAVHAAVRPVGAAPEAEAQLRRLQLSADPGRPGRFRLELQGAGPEAVSLEWPLEAVSYTVLGPSVHELQPPPGGPRAFSLHFPDTQEAQRWAALVRGATLERPSGSLPPALGPETSSGSPPRLPEAYTSMTPQPEANLPWSPGSPSEKAELAESLAQAISSGDEKGAAQAAAVLAQRQVALSVRLQEACFPSGPIRMQVTVEDASSSAHVTLQVHPQCTIATLQEQVFSEFGFPPAVQRWIIGQCLCVPERSLASYGVQNDGDPAFLYLLSAPRKASGCSPRHPHKMDGELVRLFPQSLGLPPAPQPSSSSLPSSLQPGWPCPSCTFLNPPSRPGCEMCSTQRPSTWDSTASTQQLSQVTRREDSFSLPGDVC